MAVITKLGLAEASARGFTETTSPRPLFRQARSKVFPVSAIEQSHITGREIRSAAIVRPDARQPDLGRVLRWFTDREGRLKGWTPNQRAGGWGYACAPDGMRLEAIPAQPHRQGTPAVRGRAKWRPLSVQVAAGHRRPPAGHRLLGDVYKRQLALFRRSKASSARLG